MKGKRIKWGNVLILLLIITAGVAAFYFKYPSKFEGLLSLGKNLPGIAETSQKKEPQPVVNVSASETFVLGLDSWIGGAPALIAFNREYNKDYSLSMKLQYINNDGDRFAALRDGKIHATEMSLPAFTRFQQKYPDAGVIVGITDFSRGADGIIAKSEIKTLNDMEGKTVSYVSNGTGKFILNKFLRLTGLRYQDIKPIERQEMSEVVGDLKSGKADLIVSWSPDMNIAIKEINASKSGSVRMLISTKEAPDLVPTVLIVNKGVAEQYPQKVEAFLKTWYVSAKYIIEKPDKAYETIAALMNENKDTYGNVMQEDVKDSFANIQLMSLNDNFQYFGMDGKEKKLVSIIDDTVKTWQKYGDIPQGNLIATTPSDSFLAGIYKQNDEELLVGALDTGVTGNAAPSADEKKEFKKLDGATIEKNTEKVAKVDIPPVYYDSGKATVRPESLNVLNEVTGILKQFPDYYLIVDAHTDSVGGEESNLKLSKDRAEEVRNYLLSQGIDGNRLVARGWGESKLIVKVELTEDDQAKNRRTEFILTRDVSSK